MDGARELAERCKANHIGWTGSDATKRQDWAQADSRPRRSCRLEEPRVVYHLSIPTPAVRNARRVSVGLSGGGFHNRAMTSRAVAVPDTKHRGHQI
jgi:hypothetical protein